MYLDTHNYADCSGCSACESICSKKAISFSELHNGFYYPVIDSTKCVKCNLCRSVCAFNKIIDRNDEPVIYYGWNTNEITRLFSTSGGAFYALAECFIKKHASESFSIYGASWISTDKVSHVCISSINDIRRLQRSKYIQSDLCGTFQEIRAKLENGEWVMFSGTPCQVAALNSFLGNRNRTRLLTIDLICNGIASPVVFSDYIKELNKRSKKLIRYSFRNKNIQKQSQKYVKYEFEDGSFKYREDDLFYIAYQLRLLHRESCFNCPYSERKHDADITLGDFWHIEEIIHELKKERIYGISLIMCNTEKGKDIVNNISGFNLTKTNIVPKAQRLNIKMRDSHMDLFYKNYDPELIMDNLKKYIGYKRLLRCKYYTLYNYYSHFRQIIYRGLIHGKK